MMVAGALAPRQGVLVARMSGAAVVLLAWFAAALDLRGRRRTVD